MRSGRLARGETTCGSARSKTKAAVQDGPISRRVMDRLACVNIAALPLQLLLQAEPAWRDQPAVVVEDDRPQALVLFLNARARRLGVRAGERYATARALTSDLRAGTISRARIDRGLHAPAGPLRRFSPHAA